MYAWRAGSYSEASFGTVTGGSAAPIACAPALEPTNVNSLKFLSLTLPPSVTTPIFPWAGALAHRTDSGVWLQGDLVGRAKSREHREVTDVGGGQGHSQLLGCRGDDQVHRPDIVAARPPSPQQPGAPGDLLVDGDPAQAAHERLRRFTLARSHPEEQLDPRDLRAGRYVGQGTPVLARPRVPAHDLDEHGRVQDDHARLCRRSP